MKKDNFISVGIVLNEEVEINLIEKLHSLLYDKYNYFEIVLLNYELNTDISSQLSNK